MYHAKTLSVSALKDRLLKFGQILFALSVAVGGGIAALVHIDHTGTDYRQHPIGTVAGTLLPYAIAGVIAYFIAPRIFQHSELKVSATWKKPQIRSLQFTIMIAVLVLMLGFIAWPELKQGVLIGSEVREIDRPYGTAYINVCTYFSVIGITYTIVPAEVIPTREQAEMAACPFNRGQTAGSLRKMPGRVPSSNIFDEMHDSDPLPAHDRTQK